MAARHTLPSPVHLALGSGGARGMSHIGVIRTLEEAGLSVCGVAGTSIGSAVGGVLCAGVLDAYEERMRSLTRRDILALLDPGLPASGLLGGVRLVRLMRDLCGDLPIEKLSVPFAAIAVNLGTGEEVCMQTGDLVSAIRASSSIPGVFRPVLHGSDWLVDGGLANPVPVDVARTLGPHPVIAVNLNRPSPARQAAVMPTEEVQAPESDARRETSDSFFAARASDARDEMARQIQRLKQALFPPEGEQRPSLIGSLNESIAITCHHLAKSRLSQEPPDLLIEPHLDHVGMFDFHRTSEWIDAGRMATQAALESPQGKALLESIHAGASHPRVDI